LLSVCKVTTRVLDLLAMGPTRGGGGNMFVTITKFEAVERLMADEYAGWSREGAEAIVEWIESVEEDTSDEIAFCPVAIRCEWSEYASVQEAAREYGWVPESHEDDWDAEAMEWLRDRTTVIEFDSKRNAGVIVAGF